MAEEETPHNAADLFGSDEDEEVFDNNTEEAQPDDDDADAQPASQPTAAITARERLEALAGKKRREQEEEEEATRASKRQRASDIPEQEDLFGDDDDEEEEAPAAPVIDQEFDGEGQVTEADRAFIDDTGVDAEDVVPFGEEDPDAPMYQHEEAEEGDEFERMMEERKRRRNKGMSDMEIREFVENLIHKLEGADNEDKKLLKQNQPAIARLKILPDFEAAVARPQLHRWLLDAGILAIFNHWLYPHQNGTLPNIRLRTSLLKMLTRLNIDTSLEHRRDQVKRSGVGKVVMFYAKLGDETASNRKLAAALVEHWSKPVYEQYSRRDRQEMPDEEAERMRELKRAQAAREEAAMAVLAKSDAKPGQKGFRWHARIPQAARLDYIKRPQADPQLAALAAVGPKTGRAAQPAKLEKKLKVLSSKKDTGRAANVSVEGRGLTL